MKVCHSAVLAEPFFPKMPGFATNAASRNSKKTLRAYPLLSRRQPRLRLFARYPMSREFPSRTHELC